ncbi:hypothetical protein GCM10022403_033350 [Streptomyces coacervatus]|uniref:Uncharacterized protein n=1 Tax=Streptomyces coacervatus TaxID=647381 RepID=A0ABP7HL88_9ACTN
MLATVRIRRRPRSRGRFVRRSASDADAVSREEDKTSPSLVPVFHPGAVRPGAIKKPVVCSSGLSVGSRLSDRRK